VIDATERGLLARAAGGQAAPFPAGVYTFTRRIIAGDAPSKTGNLRVKKLEGMYDTRVTGVKPADRFPEVITGHMFECE
jgi:hypothetical protein